MNKKKIMLCRWNSCSRWRSPAMCASPTTTLASPAASTSTTSSLRNPSSKVNNQHRIICLKCLHEESFDEKKTMCILPPKRGNQKIEFDLPARIGASNLQEIFNLHEKMRQELNISIWEESFDQNTAQCKMAQQVKASSAKIVAHRGSKFEVDRCHQLSSPVLSCQYFHHLLLERPES